MAGEQSHWRGLQSHRRGLQSRWRCLFAGGTLTLLVTAGCSGDRGEPTGPSPASPPGSPPVAEVVEDRQPEFPTTAQEYAERTVAAWAAPDLIRLGELATNQVRQELLDLPGPPARSWRLIDCDDPPGCTFYNPAGDQLELEIDTERLGASQAATGVTFDPAQYSDEPVAYVAAFVTAWQDGNVGRMRTLAPPAVSARLGPPPPPEAEIGYALEGTAGPLATVTVTVAGGPEEESARRITATVDLSRLGNGHALRAVEVDSLVGAPA